MSSARLLKTVCIVFGIVFALSILTVESHATEQGSIAARLPTIIDGSIEFAVVYSHRVELNVFRAIEYLCLSSEMLSFTRFAVPLQLYRAPPQ